MNATVDLRTQRLHAWQWLLLGTLLAGTFDLAFAFSFWWLKAGVTLTRIGQSIASGLLGNASFDGGHATALLGFALHYGIMLAMVTTYYLASRRLPWMLARRGLVCGIAYGLGLYVVMNYVVLPLSAAGPAVKDALWIALSIVAHVLIGVACAYFSRQASRP